MEQGVADAPAILPEAIDVERTAFEEHARDRADKALRGGVLLLVVDVALVAATFAVSHFSSQPLEPWFIAVLVGSLLASVLLWGVIWLPAHHQRKHYDSKASSTWSLRCHDTGHEWRIEGIGPAAGWRDIHIECKALPRHKDRLIGTPKLSVRIDNERGVLKSGRLEPYGEDTSLFVIDKAGLALGITIGHVEPKKASQEEPWIVELTVLGDANARETLLAWPVGGHGGGAGTVDEAGPGNRQA